MNKKDSLIVCNKIFKSVFNSYLKLNLEEILEKFAFDVKLPKEVIDSLTHEKTWARDINYGRFITQTNMENYDADYGWSQKHISLTNLNEILKAWKKINYTTTERVYDSINVHESDPIYECENIFRCTDLRKVKNGIFCDGCNNCNDIIGCQRTANSSYSIRVNDSASCINSYNVICSAKISNSFFIQDCNNLNECMFCSHISNKKYYIANMPFEETEYFKIKKLIIAWILKEK